MQLHAQGVQVSALRAKLSDRAERCWAYYDGDQGAGAALGEAWAILAVSEPGIWIGGPGAACGWAQRDITSKGGPTPTMELSALATALAADRKSVV